VAATVDKGHGRLERHRFEHIMAALLTREVPETYYLFAGPVGSADLSGVKGDLTL
jgi:hypothetical protein